MGREPAAAAAPRRGNGAPEESRAHAMSWWRRALGWLRRVRDRVPGLRVLTRAVINYIRHQSANQAGSVAFSSVLAMFPLLLFLSAAAGFVGQPGAAAGLADRVMEYAPPAVADALKPVIDEVLGQRSRALLTIGIIATIWTASSGAQAVRTALNRAYGVGRGLPFWQARIKVTLFTVIGTMAAVLVFSSVVILPYAWDLVAKAVGTGQDALWLRTGARYGLAFVVLVIVYAAFYGWLPDIPQRLRTVLPGALVGAVMWLGAAAILSYTLRSAGKLTLVYGGFAGLVATLVFLYVSAVTVIFGAEINGVLHETPATRRKPNPRRPGRKLVRALQPATTRLRACRTQRARAVRSALPVRPSGRAAARWMPSGSLWRSIRAAAQRRSASAPSVAPGRGTNMTCTASPRRSSGTPVQSAPLTSGWSANRFSISAGAILLPPREMISLIRPTSSIRPSARRHARSPVRK